MILNMLQHAILQGETMRKSIIIISLMLFLTVQTSCVLFQSEIASVTDLLPRDSDVPGWVRNYEVQYYKGDNIKKYRREYGGIGIEKIGSCIYSSIDNPEVTIRLEVIKFNSVLNAYGFFSTKRGPGIFEALQVNEYYTNSVSLVQIGEYVMFAETDKIENLLKNDLKTIANIPLLYIGRNYSTEKLPESLNLLKGFDGYGILYSKKPYYRFRHVNRIYFTQWIWEKDQVEVFFSDNESFFNAYEIFMKTAGNGYIISSSDNIYAAFRKEVDGKYTFISVIDRFIIGCWSVADIEEGSMIMNELKSRIIKFKEREGR